jgi:ATP-dependent Lhr-like helicase
MSSDAFLALQKKVRNALLKNGIIEPSDIQRLAIPAILEGKNVLLIAATGTGKTWAAVLPVLDRFLSYRDKGQGNGISILYITPLRALNRDILRRISEIGNTLDMRIEVRHGDTPSSIRALQARSPPDMLITTPETLQAILPGRRMRQHLRAVRWVIIDEVHELATDKRGAQLSLALERLGNITGTSFQRIGLSATIGDEEKIASFLGGTDRDVLVIKSEEAKSFELSIEHVTPSRDDYDEAERFGIPPASVSRAKRIVQLILDHASTLVFTNTREHAEALGSQIRAIFGNLPIRVHHGSLSREIREEVEKSFQAGDLKAVVCTSSLELGIDVGEADFVIQYLSPRETSRLIQRIGRSAHRLGGVPQGRIIAGWVDDILESAVIVKNAGQSKLERIGLHENALDVLAHQIVGLTLDEKGIGIEKVLHIVRGAYLYRGLELDDFRCTLKQLEDLGLIKIRESRLYPSFPRCFRYYYQNLSVIPDVKRYDVFDFIRKKRIGTLDQEFVAKRCKPGTEFIMHGYTWKVIGIDEEKLSVEVEPTTPSLNAIPSWEGEMIPVSYQTAIEVGRLRRVIAESLDSSQLIARIAGELKVDDSAIKKVAETLRNHIRDYPLPTDTRVVVEKFENCVIVHCCFGNLVNDTIALALAAILSAKLGVNIATQTDPYRIGLICPFKIDARTVANELSKLTSEALEQIVIEALKETELFAWYHWHVCRRIGVVDKSTEYQASKAKLLVKTLSEGVTGKETRREILTEKLDLETTKLVIERLHSHQIQLESVEQIASTCSPLAMPMIDKIVPHDLLRPTIPTRTLTEIVKERLHSQELRLVCVFNGDWEGIRTVKDLPETIRCPKCYSSLIAATYPSNQELIKIVRKRRHGLALSPDEEHAWNRAWLSASLIQTNGKRAVIAMSAKGVGPTTAIRILRRPHRTEGDFYVDILKAEREYARTRVFWD